MAGGSKSKQKGSRGELELCKKLGEVFDGSFIRSHGSGALVGGKNSHRKASLSENQIRGVKSDIIPPDFMPRFVVESKLYAEIPYHQFFSGEPVALIDSWISQILTTIDEDDFWALIFRADRRPWVILIEAKYAQNLNLPDTHFYYASSNESKYVLCNLDQFLHKCKDDILKLTE